MTRGWGYRLQLLLGLVSAVILRSESRGTHNHILLSQIRDSCNLEGQVLVHILPRIWMAMLPIDNLLSLNAKQTPFIVVLQSFPWKHVCLRRRYSVTAAYTCLLKICCLAADVVSLFVWRSLPSNGSRRYSINILVHTFSNGLCISNLWMPKVRVKVTLQLTVGQSLGVEPYLGFMTRFHSLFGQLLFCLREASCVTTEQAWMPASGVPEIE
jgi:hypothetical protein